MREELLQTNKKCNIVAFPDNGEYVDGLINREN
jgi:hypothetical protein